VRAVGREWARSGVACKPAGGVFGTHSLGLKGSPPRRNAQLVSALVSTEDDA
jgi:hypothetical protein